jgi:hypothetical protein
LYFHHDIFCYSFQKLDYLVPSCNCIYVGNKGSSNKIVICYIGHYVDTWYNVTESIVEDSLSNCTLDCWYARIFILVKE